MRPPIRRISAMNCCSRRIETFCPLSQNTLFKCHFVPRRLHYGFLQNSLIFYRIIIKLIPILTSIIVPWYHSFHRVSNLYKKINKIFRGPPTRVLCQCFAQPRLNKAMYFIHTLLQNKYEPISRILNSSKKVGKKPRKSHKKIILFWCHIDATQW